MAKGWRQTREYRQWRIAVLLRDNRTCQVCGEKKKSRHAHHLNHSTFFPDQKFDVDNGITLCQKCHSHFHNDFKASTRAKCTEHDMNEYRKLANYFFEISLVRLFKKELIDPIKVDYNADAKIIYA